MRTVWLTSSSTGPNTSVLKPVLTALSRYLPGIRLGETYKPSPSDSAFVCMPLSADRIRIFAWGTTALDGSRTSPRNAPPEICAGAVPATKKAAAIMDGKHLIRDVVYSFSFQRIAGPMSSHPGYRRQRRVTLQ